MGVSNARATTLGRTRADFTPRAPETPLLKHHAGSKVLVVSCYRV